MKLRPSQVAAVRACFKAWKEHCRLLMVLPTGAGKTVVFSHISKHVVDRGHRVLILAHREELLEQAGNKLKAAVGLEAQIEKAGSNASREAPVVLALQMPDRSRYGHNRQNF